MRFDHCVMLISWLNRVRQVHMHNYVRGKVMGSVHLLLLLLTQKDTDFKTKGLLMI